MPQDEKRELLAQYEAWCGSPISQELLKFLEASVVADEDSENKSVFESEFKSSQEYAWHRGYRTAVRNVTKQIKRDE